MPMTSKIAVPYTKIQENWQEFISPDDLPDNIPFNHPCRYRAASTHAILKLWRKRQANGQQPFQFRATLSKEGTPEPARCPDGELAPASINKLKNVKGKHRSLRQNISEGSDSPDSFDGDESVSISDSTREESNISDDTDGKDNVDLPSSVPDSIHGGRDGYPPDTAPGSHREPFSPETSKVPRKFQPVVTITTRPPKIAKPSVSSNEQLATPLASEPPEEGTMRSLRVTTLERRARQISQAVSEKLEKGKTGESSSRKSP